MLKKIIELFSCPVRGKRLQKLLGIGYPPGVKSDGGGIGKFIELVFRFPCLIPRAAVLLIVWKVSALLGVPIAPSLFLLLAELYISLIVLRILVFLLQFGQLGRTLAAMCLPIGVIGFAAYLLFVNEQGRELGVGLMDWNGKGVFLAFILIYWACNNWLSARIGLTRAFPEPKKEQFLLFWGPRVVGVFAHLLAGVSLSFAAYNQQDLRQVEPWLVYAAPLAIVLATVFAWSLDYLSFSERNRGDWKWLALILMPLAGLSGISLLFYLGYSWRSGVVPVGFFLATLSIAVSAVGFLVVISWIRSGAPNERATCWQRKKALVLEQKNIAKWTKVLFYIMAISTVAIWTWPMQIGQLFGSLNIACFAFGSFLAVANMADLLVSRLTRRAKGAGFALGPGAIAALVLGILVIPTVSTSLTQTFHRVRLCGKECTAAPKLKEWSAVESPAQRPTVSEAARAWYAQAEPIYHSLYPGKPVPMLIVATAGGGIRAAYWTATILETLERDLCRDALKHSSPDEACSQSLMRNLLFAISGVSGGSVGAAAYAAAVQEHEASANINRVAVKPTDYLKEDFLAPGLASMIFIDGLSNVVPDVGQIDRGQALELGFENASRPEGKKDALASHKFLSFFPAINVAKPNAWRPALLFNATHQETGRRIITSHVKIERNVFLDSYDALNILGSDIRLSTAAHNSARFTYVSPAGSLMSATEPSHNRGYVIDGGYFENYGAATALELARQAIDAIDPGRENKVKLVVLQISSDPTLKEDRTLVRVRSDKGQCVVSSFAPAIKSGSQDQANYLNLIDPVGGQANEGEGFVLAYANELSAPLVGIMSVRGAHGTVAAAELAASICQGKGAVEQALKNALERKSADAAGGTTTTANVGGADAPHFSHMAMCEVSSKGGVGISPPLGWVLSDRTRSKFKDILGDCGNAQELTALEKALGLPIPASSAPRN